MIRKCHNHTLQTNPRHCEEESDIINNKTSEGQGIKEESDINNNKTSEGQGIKEESDIINNKTSEGQGIKEESDIINNKTSEGQGIKEESDINNNKTSERQLMQSNKLFFLVINNFQNSHFATFGKPCKTFQFRKPNSLGAVMTTPLA